jgi:nitrogen-specific signal transduction histidine kinase
MEHILLTSLPVWAINFALGGLVYIREPRKASHQAFAAYALTMVLWSIGVKMAYAQAGAPLGTMWGRFTFIGAGLIGLSFVIFCQVFPDRQQFQASTSARGVLLFGAGVTVLTFTPLVLRKVGLSDSGSMQAQYGPCYPVFGIFMLLAFGHGIWALTKKWHAARGRSRQQILYLWLGLCLAIGGGTTTNLIIPALTGSSRFSGYGPYFTLVFVGLTAHAIIRHRLMDIRLVIRQSLTYSLSLGTTIGIMWGTLAVARTVLVLDKSDRAVLPLLMGLGGVIIFQPIRIRIQRLLDKYCYREPYDYRRATGMVSQVVAELVRLGPLCEFLTNFIVQTLKVEMVGIYICHESAGLERYAARHVNGESHLPQHFPGSDIVPLLVRTKKPLVHDELEEWTNAEERGQLAAVCTALQSEVLIPLCVEDTLTAVIVVGAKQSSDPFFIHDLGFLGTVGHQASVALRRAQLYEEITWMKEYSENILRQMESGVIAVNHKGGMTMMNEAAARLLEVSLDATTGKSVTTMLPEALSGPLLEALAGTATYANQEALLPVPSRRQLPIAISTSVLRGRAEEPSGAILVFHDLSRLKELEEEKRRIERLASVGAFVAGIAHEIKNPLVAIKTLAELLPEQYDDAEFRDTFTRVALHEVERIDSLVQRLRSLGSSSPLQMRPISVLTPLDETLALISGELTKRRITLAYEHHDVLPPIMGDHDQLKQVFINVCLNGIEAMEQDGTLGITLRVDFPPDNTTGAVVIQITDTGPGIPADYLPTLFEPFVTSKDTGSGLGLAICKGIIEHHRGSITATNRTDGSGAVFTLKFPIAQQEAPYESTAPHYRYAQAAHAVV